MERRKPKLSSRTERFRDNGVRNRTGLIRRQSEPPSAATARMEVAFGKRPNLLEPEQGADTASAGANPRVRSCAAAHLPPEKGEAAAADRTSIRRSAAQPSA